jgi:hypothetical protein
MRVRKRRAEEIPEHIVEEVEVIILDLFGEPPVPVGNWGAEQEIKNSRS